MKTPKLFFAFALLCTSLCGAAERPIAETLEDLLSPDPPVSEAAASYLARCTHPGYFIERGIEPLLRALDDSRPEVVQAVVRYLANSSSWDHPKLLSGLERALDGRRECLDPSVAVKPAMKRWSSEKRLDFVRATVAGHQKANLLVLSEMRKSIRLPLRDDRVREDLLVLLTDADSEIVDAALQLIFETAAEAEHTLIPAILVQLAESLSEDQEAEVAGLLAAVVPSSDGDRTATLKAFATALRSEGLSEAVVLRLKTLRALFKKAKVAPPKPASKSKPDCPGILRKQTNYSFHQGRPPRPD